MDIEIKDSTMEELAYIARMIVSEMEERYEDLSGAYEAFRDDYDELKEKYDVLKQEESKNQKAYDLGFEDGKQSMQEKANKIIEFYRDNNNDIYVLQKVFSLNTIFDDQILEDIEGAYNKIIEYEKKKEQEEKKLHVGDEVLFEGDKCVVLNLEDGYASILTHDGTGGFLKYSYEFEKTGKHYPIDEILKELE